MNNLKERIESNIRLSTGGCWVWQGCKRNFGYGYMTVGSRRNGTRRTVGTHRVSYTVFKGKIKKGLWVLHTCDNRACVNPDHLYLGTRADNVRDMVSRGRVGFAVGEKCGSSKLTEAQVVKIRYDRSFGMTYRALAKKNGLKSHKSVIEICKGRSWKHLLKDYPIQEERRRNAT